MENNPNGWEWLTDCVPEGREEAVSAPDLAYHLDMDTRDLRRVVENARKNGVLICGDDHGYYFPESYEEIRDYINRVSGRINTARQCLIPFISRAREMARDSERSGNG